MTLDFASPSTSLSAAGGIVIFELLQEKRDREELVAALLARFDVEEDTARRDVDTFLSGLLALDYFRPRSPLLV